ncbi:short-chain dehydrogenase [Capnocytophaga sp. HP1101]
MSKTALITGGATGIGKQTAIRLLQKGINVVITGRRKEVGEKAAAELAPIATNGAKIKFVQNDVRDEQAVKQLIADIVSEFGSLDYAVNNAAVPLETAQLPQSNTDLYKEMVDINILGVYYCMKYEIAQMQQQGGGAIVNLCSIAGLNGIPYANTYASTKHAVVGLTKSCALDHATEGIRINGVAPGATRTEIIAKQISGEDENIDPEELNRMHPMNRMGLPEEIAGGIAWLLSDEASFVTGHILSIDGGFQAK